MYKKIIGTLGTRVLGAILSFSTWILNAQYLGAEKLGTISLMIFSVAIIQLLTNFFSGAALIYQTPRAGVYRLLIPAYIFTPIITVAGSCLLFFVGTLFPILEIPKGYFAAVLALALIMSFTSVNYMLLLGLEKVNGFNLCNLIQAISLMLLLLFFLFGVRIHEVMTFYWAIFISYIIAFIISVYMLAPFIRQVPLTGMRNLIGDILRFGAYVQFANFFQTMNYRLSLKFVDLFAGRAAVGVLSLGMQLAEGLWLISRSIGTVQYSRLSNEMNYDYSVRLSLTFAKISWVVTALAMTLLLCIPQIVFTSLFSASFREVKPVIASLAFGIVMLSVSIILSGFFSAINKPWYNTVGSAVGLVFTIALGLILVPRYGIIGAGISASVSYTFITLFQFIVFSRMTKLTLRDFMLTRSEIRLLIGELKKISR
ncbi:MAG: polysaccharide biosynthesis C-terminal domain-containing protein [Bacteroidetes bacterium]|nr:polysaccharide biosynthesis C-terminal domain-containing protein [Bacteroidota bacterium]